MPNSSDFKIKTEVIKILLGELGISISAKEFTHSLMLHNESLDFSDLEIVLANKGYELVPFSGVSFSDISYISLILSEDNNFYITKRQDRIVRYYDLSFSELFLNTPLAVRQTYHISPISKNENSIYKIGKNWFWKLFSKQKSYFSVVFITSFLLSLTTVLIPLFISLFYSQIIPSSDGNTQFGLLFGIIILISFTFGLKFIRTLFIGRISYLLGAGITRQVFRRILYLPPAFTEIAPISSQISRIRDFESIRHFLTDGGENYYDLPFTLILIIAMFYFAGIAAWIPVVALIMFFLLAILSYPYVKRYNDSITSSGGEYQQFLLELTTQLKDIKNYNGQKQWPRRFDDFLRSYLKSAHKVNLLYAFINTVSSLIVNLSGLFTIVLGVNQVIAGHMSSGELMASLILVWRILGPVRTGFNSISQVNRVRASIAQLERFMTLKQEDNYIESFANDYSLNGDIEFSGVSLRYSKDSLYALVNISLKLQKNNFLGVIGHGGSGKSSLLKLVMGLYPIPLGRILLNNQNIEQYNAIKLREKIGYLEQNPRLVPGTLGENLNITDKELEDDYVKKIIKILNLDTFFDSLSNGLATTSEEICSRFHKSIRSKLGLLRISIQKSEFILLDEPLKGIARNEHDCVLNWVHEYKNKVTMIIVTNDPQLLQLTNTAIILNNARIVDSGNPSSLIKSFSRGTLGAHE